MTQHAPTQTPCNQQAITSVKINLMAVTRVPCVERANKGQFMLTEATLVTANGHGYPNTPGIYTEEQMNAWKPIVSAVKDKGAIFFCQIWHCGRASHSVYNKGALPAVISYQPLAGGMAIKEGHAHTSRSPRVLLAHTLGLWSRSSGVAKVLYGYG